MLSLLKRQNLGYAGLLRSYSRHRQRADDPAVCNFCKGAWHPAGEGEAAGCAGRRLAVLGILSRPLPAVSHEA